MANSTDPFGKQPGFVSRDLSKQQGATRWVGDRSNLAGGKAYWNPSGSGWQEINEGMLGNPDVARAVMQGVGDTRSMMQAPGGAQAYRTFSGLQNKINPSVLQGIQGSSFSLDPSVLSKMWK